MNINFGSNSSLQNIPGLDKLKPPANGLSSITNKLGIGGDKSNFLSSITDKLGIGGKNNPMSSMLDSFKSGKPDFKNLFSKEGIIKFLKSLDVGEKGNIEIGKVVKVIESLPFGDSNSKFDIKKTMNMLKNMKF